jgi:protein-tyrosine kinase
MRNVAKVSHLNEVQRHGERNGIGAPTNGAARSSPLPVADLVRDEPEKRCDPEFTLGVDLSREDAIAGARKPAMSVIADDENKFIRRSASRSWWHRLLGRSDIARDDLGLIAQREGFAEGNEQFALLATRLRRWVEEQHKRIVLVTSAVPGEGKSFVALNLAAALAEAESDVLLVDADLRKPSLHEWLNVTPSYGLSDYLSGNIELTRCLSSTHLPRLTLLPGGNAPRSGSVGFAGPRLRELVRELRALNPRPLVLFDAPAILTAPEVQILADLLDAVMIVVAANKTSRAVFLKALDAVKETPFFGAVLNRFEVPFSATRAVRRRASEYAAAASDRGSRQPR